MTSRTIRLLLMDLRKTFPRSARVKAEDYVHLARMIDKCRAVLMGTEGEYIYPCPMDERLMEFAGITAEQFTATVEANPTDEGVARWFRERRNPIAGRIGRVESDDARSRAEYAGKAGRISTSAGMPSIPRGPTSPAGPTCRTWKKAARCRRDHS